MRTQMVINVDTIWAYQ